MSLDQIKKVLFLGIGGIGMSALARFMNERNIEVLGYDKTPSPLTKMLESEGMKIEYEEQLSLVKEDLDLVIYTPAIPNDNQLLKHVKSERIPLQKRAEVLGMISKSMRTIAVAGTHGKTSTTALLIHMLKENGINCTGFVGGIMKGYESNYISGNNEWIVLEADEYDRSFMHLEPEIIILNSMDPDHLDIYQSHEEMESTFNAFVNKVEQAGVLIAHQSLTSRIVYKGEMISFGEESGTCRLVNRKVEDGKSTFTINKDSEAKAHYSIELPGRYNAENVLAAAIAADRIGCDFEHTATAMITFKGIRRRFDVIHRSNKLIYIDDYAHHPEELRAVITAVRDLFPGKCLTGIFQPHLYSRTKDFAREFAMALDLLDRCVLLDIYPAREKPILGVSTDLVFSEMKIEHKSRSTLRKVVNEIELEDTDVLMTLGAGDIDTIVDDLKQKIEELN